MINKIYIAIMCVCVFALSGCATVVNGTTQTVKITTPPTKNAKCELTNNVGTWFLNSTPGMVEVHHAKGPLMVKCNKDGYVPAKVSVKSHMSAMIMGNVLVGGIIGAVADTEDGAAYNYPSDITVPMYKILQKTKPKFAKHADKNG